MGYLLMGKDVRMGIKIMEMDVIRFVMLNCISIVVYLISPQYHNVSLLNVS